MAAVQCSSSSAAASCCSSGGSFLAFPFRRPKHIPTISSLPIKSTLPINLSFSAAFPNGGVVGFGKGVVEKRKAVRMAVVCEEASTKKKYDSAEKRARQAEKRRIYNKSKKSEIRTRMKKVLVALDALKKKKGAQAEEILSIEKLIAEAYSAIDKAVRSGTIHRNTGANRKSRLARRKKAIEIHHGWYVPAATA